MVYEAEGVGLLMDLHLLKNLHIKLTHPTILGSDSQAVLKALDNQWSHPRQYILNSIHSSAENLYKKQDGLINQAKQEEVITAEDSWKGRVKGEFDLQMHWVHGHVDFALNELADEETKKVVKRDSSDAKYLPALLCKHLPLSVTALRQNHMDRIKKQWECRWKSSPREDLLKTIDNSAPSKKYLWLISNLDWHQTSILFQL